jgi:tetratricopeptide (TPR) repeat protein
VKWVVPAFVALLALAFRLGYLFELSEVPRLAAPALDAAGFAGSALYTALLELQWANESLWWPRLLQAILGSLSCGLVWIIGRSLFPSGVALVAALAAAMYGPLIYYGGELLPATISVFAILLLFWLLTRMPLAPVWRWVVPGLATGVATLTTPVALLLLPFLIWWLARFPRDTHGDRSRGWHRGVWLTLGFGLVIAPMGAMHEISLYSGLPGSGPAGVEGVVPTLADRLYHFWSGAEIPHDLDLYFARGESDLLSVLLWHRWIAFPFGLIGPLALVGLVLHLRTPEGRSRMGLLLAGIVIASGVAVLLRPVTSLTRLPVVPLLLLLASYGGYRMFRMRPRPVAIGITLILIAALNVGVVTVSASGTAREHFVRGLAFDTHDMPANAMREYRRALKADPELPDALLKLAELLSHRGESAASSALYRRYLEQVPESIAARRELAMALLAAGDQDQALQEMEEIVALEPGRADLHGTLAFVSLLSDRPDRATRAYRRVLALRPDSALVRYQLARLHESQDRADSAEAQYRLSLRSAPKHIDTHQGLADLLIANAPAPSVGQELRVTPALQEAEELLQRVIALDGKSLAARWSLGPLLAREGRYEASIRQFEAILELSPDEYEAHLYLGGLYRRTGMATRAEEEFDIYTQEKRVRRMEATARSQSEELARQLLGE